MTYSSLLHHATRWCWLWSLVTGSVDFVPPMIHGTRPFRGGPNVSFHPFTSAVQEANKWLRAHPGLHVITNQSIDFKIDQNWGKRRNRSVISGIEISDLKL